MADLPWSQMIINGVTLSVIYIVFAAGLTLVFGIMHIINFAHGELFMVAGFIAITLAITLGMNYFLVLIIVALVMAVIGILLERGVFRVHRGVLLPGAMCALGTQLILQNAAQKIWGIEVRSLPSPMPFTITIFGGVLTAQKLLILVVGTAVIVGLYLFLTRTNRGLAMHAVEQNSEAASLQGIDINGTSRLAMALGVGLAGVAATFIVPTGVVHPYIGIHWLFVGLTIIIVGGMGSLTGAIIAGFIIGMLESFVGTLWSYWGTTVVSMAIIFIILLVRPKGLKGH